MAKFKVLTVYGYHDGPTLFTAMSNSQEIYLFRWTGEDDPLGYHVYKADCCYEGLIKQNEVDWSEVQT